MQGRGVVGLTNKKGGGSEEEEEAERRERGREGEEVRPTRGKGQPEEFSTVKLVGEERGGTGEERQGRSFSSASVSRVWTD